MGKVSLLVKKLLLYNKWDTKTKTIDIKTGQTALIV